MDVGIYRLEPLTDFSEFFAIDRITVVATKRNFTDLLYCVLTNLLFEKFQSELFIQQTIWNFGSGTSRTFERAYTRRFYMPMIPD
jgi:hypothetical protein